jgi:hypothetical protein
MDDEIAKLESREKEMGMKYEKSDREKEIRKSNPKPDSSRFNYEKRNKFRIRGEIQLTELFPGEYIDAFIVKRGKGADYAGCFKCNAIEKEAVCVITPVKGRAICPECVRGFCEGDNALKLETVARVFDTWKTEQELIDEGLEDFQEFDVNAVPTDEFGNAIEQ